MEDEETYFDIGAKAISSSTSAKVAAIKTPQGIVNSSAKSGVGRASVAKVTAVATAAVDYDDVDHGRYDNELDFDDGQQDNLASSASSSAVVTTTRPITVASKKATSKSTATTKGSRVVVSSRIPQEEEDDDDNDGEEKEEEREVRTAPKPKKKALPATSEGPPKKVARVAEPKQKVASAASRRDAVLIDEQNDDDLNEDQYFSPGGSDNRRKRASLGVASADQIDDGASRKSSRRRWKVLDHWKGERVKYRETEDGEAVEAVAAERLGVLSPKVEGLYKKRTQSAAQGGKARSISQSKKTIKAAVIEDEDDNEEEERDPPARTSKGSGGTKQQHSAAASGAGSSSAVNLAAIFKDKETLRARPEVQALIKESLRTAVYNAGKGSIKQATLPPSELPAAFVESDRPNLIVHGAGGVPSHQIQVLRKSTQLAYEKLPSSEKSKTHPGNAMAAAAFDAPQFISGTVRLASRSVKELESTHNCTQAFVVLSGQPRSVQVDIGTQSYLVSPGDHFFVPENCDYRLTNHSQDTNAEIAFVVIKPRAGDDIAASPR